MAGSPVITSSNLPSWEFSTSLGPQTRFASPSMSKWRVDLIANRSPRRNTMSSLWERYQKHLCSAPSLGLTLDISRMRFEDGFIERMAAPMQRAFEAMAALEYGAIANADENRMVGHYWLRAPELAPTSAIATEI